MTIVHHLDKHGSFTCGDTETRVTSYAYPTSTYATQAKRTPRAVAFVMVAKESRYGLTHEAEYDARQWAKLKSAGVVTES